jgi:hypothetical protein
MKPTERIHQAFGWAGFPDALFFEAEHALRFDLGGDIAMNPLRFLQAMDRARAVAEVFFQDSQQVSAVACYYSGERRSNSGFAALRALEKIGFDTKFGAVEKVKLDDLSYISQFGEDLCKYWQVADFNNNTQQFASLFWASISREMDIQPKARWLDSIYIVDFDRRIAVHVYDDRAMDAISAEPEILQCLFDKFKGWLYETELEVMNQKFGQD